MIITAMAMFGSLAVLSISGGWQWFRVSSEQLDSQRFAAAQGARSSYIALPTAVPAPAPPTSATGPAPLASTTGTVTGLAPATSDFRQGRSLRGLLAWLPTGVVFALAAPFPWTARRALELATIPEMLLWYVALVLAVIGVVVHWRDWRRYSPLVLYIAGVVLVLAISQGNVGTLVRSRGMMIPFTLIFSGAGAAWLWDWLSQRRASRVADTGAGDADRG